MLEHELNTEALVGDAQREIAAFSNNLVRIEH
jgi:hypothetical protein